MALLGLGGHLSLPEERRCRALRKFVVPVNAALLGDLQFVELRVERGVIVLRFVLLRMGMIRCTIAVVLGVKLRVAGLLNDTLQVRHVVLIELTIALFTLSDLEVKLLLDLGELSEDILHLLKQVG